MVIHEDNDAPVELPVIRKPAVVNAKKYVLIKNHVKEVIFTGEDEPSNKLETDIIHEVTGKTRKKKRRKTPKVQEIPPEVIPKPDVASETTTTELKQSCEIESNDLNELKEIYLKCKSIITRIESKYGHLLELQSENNTNKGIKSRKRKHLETTSESDSDQVSDQCCCDLKQKIIFDESGKQILTATNQNNHICVKKPKLYTSKLMKEQITVNIDINETDDLPDDLLQLTNLLNNRDLDNNERNRIITKLKYVRQNILNELKFNKGSLMEQLKNNPDDMLDFQGTNLGSLSGYSPEKS